MVPVSQKDKENKRTDPQDQRSKYFNFQRVRGIARGVMDDFTTFLRTAGELILDGPRVFSLLG